MTTLTIVENIIAKEDKIFFDKNGAVKAYRYHPC